MVYPVYCVLPKLFGTWPLNELAMRSKDELTFLQNYSTQAFDMPLTSVDNCIFTFHEDQLKVLLVKRVAFPDKGKWSIPGGFIDLKVDVDLAATALRKLKEKTGVASPYLEQCETVGNAHRDPRGWAVTTLYFALIPYVDPVESIDQGESLWMPIDSKQVADLAFDHALLVSKALQRLRNKVLYTTLPANLLGDKFTLSELQHCYEVLLGQKMEKKSFRRRMHTSGMFVETGESRVEGAGRPAAFYRVKEEGRGFVFNRQIESLC